MVCIFCPDLMWTLTTGWWPPQAWMQHRCGHPHPRHLSSRLDPAWGKPFSDGRGLFCKGNMRRELDGSRWDGRKFPEAAQWGCGNWERLALSVTHSWPGLRTQASTISCLSSGVNLAKLSKGPMSQGNTPFSFSRWGHLGAYSTRVLSCDFGNVESSSCSVTNLLGGWP